MIIENFYNMRMNLDVIDLRNFYASPLGQAACGYIGRYVCRRWTRVEHLSILGLGYASAYLQTYLGAAERTLNFMPAEQGVVNWPTDAPSCVALVDTPILPLPDACIDRALVVHALEASRRPEELLWEIWRVLTPGGRLIVIAPNRAGLWSRAEHTPFGQGRPFSRQQLLELMRAALFSPIDWGEALYAPPFARRFYQQLSPALEAVGVSLSLPTGGVLAVEATKQLYRPVVNRRSLENVMTLPDPALVSSTRVRGRASGPA